MARPTWKGTLGFGLVNIGVELYTMESSTRLDLDMLDKRDMGRIGYQKINKSTGEIVPQKEIVKGYAIAKNRYVILSDEDFKAANPKATRTIEVLGFVDDGSIDRIYYDRPYLVAPVESSAKAYKLLYDVLERTGQIGLAHVVLHTREHTAAIYPHHGALVMQLLRYDDELRKAEDLDIDLPKDVTVKSAEYEMAEKLVETMAAEWKPDEHKDSYHEDLMKLINARAKKGGKETQEPPRTEKDETPVLDLMAALKRSLKEEGDGEREGAGRDVKRTKRLNRDGARPGRGGGSGASGGTRAGTRARSSSRRAKSA
ncbi:MAG TPA: Ku protein [Gemmatimonadaceae bacterium]|nr:Ku protein [Gemmatimonadaceae bacterium]